MFFNKKSFKNVSNECQEISKLLNFDGFRNSYSLDSIKDVDNYLSVIRKNIISEDEKQKIILRTGAYIGEVIRKFSKCNYYWVMYDDVVTKNEKIKDYGKNLLTFYMLYSEKKGFLFPMAKVSKNIDNGSEDSLEFYIKIILSKKF